MRPAGAASPRQAPTVPYQYIVLRCVPRVEREEFVNVAVVLYSQQTDFLEAACSVDRNRLLALAPRLDLGGVDAALETVCRVCRGEAAPGSPVFDRLGQRFGWLAAPRSTVIQPGPVHGGITHDPAVELTRLLDRLVR